MHSAARRSPSHWIALNCSELCIDLQVNFIVSVSLFRQIFCSIIFFIVYLEHISVQFERIFTINLVGEFQKAHIVYSVSFTFRHGLSRFIVSVLWLAHCLHDHRCYSFPQYYSYSKYNLVAIVFFFCFGLLRACFDRKWNIFSLARGKKFNANISSANNARRT